MMRTCALLSLAGGALAQGPLPPAGVSTQYLIPYVYDVELELEYNSHTFSGIADTYLQVRPPPTFSDSRHHLG